MAIVSGVCFGIFGAVCSKTIRQRAMRRTLRVSTIAQLIKTVIVLARRQNAISSLLVRPIPIDGMLGRLNSRCTCRAYNHEKRDQAAQCASHGSNVEVNIAAACSCPCRTV